jgi:hypothetical protein
MMMHASPPAGGTMTKQRPPASPPRGPRGFIVLVVLLMLAVITAVAVAQFSAVNNQSDVSIRREEETQARAIAEGCLMLAQRYAECRADRNELAPGGVPCSGSALDSTGGKTLKLDPDVDFDKILNPNDVAGPGLPAQASGAFIPTKQTGQFIVQVPPGTYTTAEHDWLFIPRASTGSANGGACLIRYDDNADDALPVTALSDDGAAHNCGKEAGVDVEGKRPDLPQCDRDKAIYITAIGIYPFIGAATQADADTAYQRAHARVTLRKLFSVGNPGNFPASIVTPGNVNIKNNIIICGAGGIVAGDVVGKFKGTSCICGDVKSTNPLETPPPLGSTCCATCNSGVASTGNPLPKKIDIDGDNVPCLDTSTCSSALTLENDVPRSPLQPAKPNAVSSDYMSNQNFGDPRSDTNNISFRSSGVASDPADECKLFHGADGTVYYWDDFDTNPINTIFVGKLGLVLPVALPNVAPLGTDDCTNYTKSIVEEPCTWDFTTPAVICGVNQTMCWKPLAKLDGALVDIDLGAGTAAEMVDTAGTSLQFTAGPLPNSATARTYFDTTAANRMCGLGQAVTSVPATTFAAGEYRVNAVSNINIPIPAIMSFDTPVHVGAVGGISVVPAVSTNGPLLASVLASGNITVANHAGLCAPQSNRKNPAQAPLLGITSDPCLAMYAANKRELVAGPPNTECAIDSNPLTATGNLLLPIWARFNMSDTQNFPSANGPLGGLPSNRWLPGVVARTDGTMNMADYTFAGLTWIKGDVDFPSGNPCFVGRLMIDGDTKMSNHGQLNVAGEFLTLGNIDGANGVKVTADLYSEGSVDIKNDFNLNGRLVVNGDFDVKNNAVVNYSGGGSTGTFANAGLSSFMESQW